MNKYQISVNLNFFMFLEHNFLHQSLASQTCENYMFHPVNTYHSLIRISKYLSKLVKLPHSFEKSLSNLIMIESQAAQGLINLHEYNEVDVMDIANGNICGYQSVSNMTASELYFVTKTAMKNTIKNGN